MQKVRVTLIKNDAGTYTLWMDVVENGIPSRTVYQGVAGGHVSETVRQHCESRDLLSPVKTTKSPKK